jgi:hypothetical protein
VSIVLRPTLLLALLALAAGGCGGSDDAPGPSPTPAQRRAATPAPAHVTAGVAWTRTKLLRRLTDRRIAIGDNIIRVDASTVTCGGTGRPSARRDGEPAWRRFRCVQPTFPPGSVAGPDAIFFVQPVDRTRIEITDRRLTAY